MKIAVIGGAGVRVPLLINALGSAGLGVDEFALYDPDARRLALIADLAARRSGGARVTTHGVVAPAVDGARFVITSIRVGGIEARIHDEASALALGFVGQETVGPGGFAMAVRTIPPLVDCAREITRRAPDAWIINFTNPAGLVTQALIGETGARVVGVCDTPTELFHEIADALQVPADECRFDYVGLNHLGFVRELWWRGRPQLHRAWEDEAVLARVYRTPLFSPARLRELRLLPSEYFFYYDSPERAVRNLRRAGDARGAVVGRLTRELFADLERGVADPVSRYERYLAERSAGYMQLEATDGADGADAAADDADGADAAADDADAAEAAADDADGAADDADGAADDADDTDGADGAADDADGADGAADDADGADGAADDADGAGRTRAAERRRGKEPPPWAHLTGYDKIALNTITAIVRGTNAIIPLNVLNRGNIPELADDDVIEAPSVVGVNGPQPLHVGALPGQVRDLVVRVKAFERATIAAVRTGTREALVDALALNPLVPSRSDAARLVEVLRL